MSVMVVAAWRFLTSKAGSYVLIGLLAVAACVAMLLWHAGSVRSHDAALEQAWQIKQTTAVDKAKDEARVAGDRAVAAAAAQARAAALAEAPVREVIRRVPVQTACVGSPAVRAALDELRHPGAGAGGSAAAPADRPAKLR